MGNVIKMPFHSRKLKSLVTLPVRWVAIDLEFNLDKISHKYEIMEISIYDIHENKEIFQSKIQIKDPSALSSWRQSNGYAKEDFINAPTMQEVDNLLPYILKSCIGVFWNQQFDLQQYPMLAVHLYGVRDCMRRFSSTYGSYSPDFGDRKFDKLSVAAQKAGIYIEDDELYHTASTDSRITAELWKYCDLKDLPFEEIPSDLILRSEAEQIMEQLKLELVIQEDEKSSLASEALDLSNLVQELEETIESGEMDQSEKSEDLPF